MADLKNPWMRVPSSVKNPGCDVVNRALGIERGLGLDKREADARVRELNRRHAAGESQDVWKAPGVFEPGVTDLAAHEASRNQPGFRW